MGSAITFSGFNNIDWSMILDAIMAQERLPVTTLEAQQTALESQKRAFSTLASRLSALQTASETLSYPHMAREILRTVEPAKVSACQSAEKP